MGIERQVIGKKTDLAAKQRRQPTTPDSGNPPILAAPEIAVMHQQGIGIPICRGINQRLARGNTCDQTTNLLASFHLQSVWAIILEAPRIKQPVEIFVKLVPRHEVHLPAHSVIRTVGHAAVNPGRGFERNTVSDSKI